MCNRQLFLEEIQGRSKQLLMKLRYFARGHKMVIKTKYKLFFPADNVNSDNICYPNSMHQVNVANELDLVKLQFALERERHAW